jgi:anti-sigma B factor antagonist
MSLNIEQRETEGIVILDLHGSLALDNGESELRDRLARLSQACRVNVVLNLKGVDYIDSTGLGTLVFGLARLRKAGGKLALENLNQAHLELLSLTRLAIAFELFDDEGDAVNSFFPDRKLHGFDILDFVEHENASSPSRAHTAC